MDVLALESDRLRLEVAPQAGASVVTFAMKRDGDLVPIWRPTPAAALASGNSSLMASFALIPFSNRIRDGKFRFAGKSYALRPNTPDGHAIHGDVRKRPWTLAAHSADELAFAFSSADFADINFPFPFASRLTYRLRGAELEVGAALVNTGSQAMPAGIGFHPYYQRALLHQGEPVLLCAAARGVYPELVPSGGAVPLAPEQDFSLERAIPAAGFDHCFAGWDGRAVIRWPKSRIAAHLVADSALGHLILFTPPGEPFFAVEPVSNANNGFNLLADGVPDSGVRVLAPGAELRTGFRLRLAAEGDPK